MMSNEFIVLKRLKQKKHSEGMATPEVIGSLIRQGFLRRAAGFEGGYFRPLIVTDLGEKEILRQETVRLLQGDE